jgi:hypothetical protein
LKDEASLEGVNSSHEANLIMTEAEKTITAIISHV